MKKKNIKNVRTIVKAAKGKTALIKENKIHTGFRLSKDNYDLLGKYEKNLGISRTGVVDMILTVVRKDEKLLLNLIGKALKHK
ncbi:MAG: hypothetical protein HY738_00125 [Bacteroidia bacterium]|nr:hypothetical protein [Bacteroidia bacterium]